MSMCIVYDKIVKERKKQRKESHSIQLIIIFPYLVCLANFSAGNKKLVGGGRGGRISGKASSKIKGENVFILIFAQ